MKNVMTRAWEIAKEGQKEHGGKVSEYFAEALKMAWGEWNTFKNNLDRLEKLNAEAVRITHKVIKAVRYEVVLEQAKVETGERYNRAMKNIQLLTDYVASKLREIKAHRGIA